MNIKLEGIFELKSPLSHIGESVGPDSYLAEEKIITEDGEIVDCFVYSGNGFRGQLRDCAAEYMLEKLDLKIDKDTFHLLFSGGTLGGRQKIDISQARKFRELMPCFSIFGGGVGNQILSGKMNIGQVYPIVEETTRIVPDRYHLDNMNSWKHWTMEKSFTRKDDNKDENLRNHLDKTEDEESDPQQMRYSIELLAPGSKLYQRIDLKDFTELELGAFVSGLYELAKHPKIGGKSGVGMGQIVVEYKYSFNPFEPAEDDFVAITANGIDLSDKAKKAKQKYDDYLAEVDKDELREVI